MAQKPGGINRHIVSSLEEIDRDVFILSFTPLTPFVPGQIVALTLDPGGLAPRLYSLCGGSSEPYMRILFNVVPGGELTEDLAGLKPGDPIYCSTPYGRFRIGEEPAIWIANGTGVAPFVSMVLSGGGTDATLIHGGRGEGSFYFSSLLSEKLGRRYKRCSTTETGPEYFEGRVTAWLRESKELRADIRYYLCGSSLMVVEARDILISKGIPFSNIVSEIYF